MNPVPTDRHAVPDGRARVEFATRLALWVICDDEQIEDQAHAQRDPEDVENWARRALSGVVAVPQLDKVDYVRLYALLR